MQVEVPDEYVERLLDRTLDSLLQQFPVTFITGPRATGKTTTAERLARTRILLDREEQLSVVRSDPDAALYDRPTPVLIDEWQLEPAVLGAIKRIVDRNHAPGQFIVTGSARAELETSTWPGTGRLLRLPMLGLTVRERRGNLDHPGFIDRIAADGIDALESPDDPPDLRGYISELLTSGFPEAALRRDGLGRELWLESYIEDVINRDVDLLSEHRNRSLLHRYLEALAVNTAGVVDDKTLYEAAGITRETARDYERLFTGLSLLEIAPAWWSNRVKRLTQRPKRFLVDSAFTAAVLRIDEEGILRNGTVLGRLLETFVYSQLQAEAPISRTRARLHHLRTRQGREEIDIVAELRGQRLLGIEVKATASPTRQDARHLLWLQNSMPERFVGGVVLHTGSRVFRLAEGVVAAPVATLWS